MHEVREGLGTFSLCGKGITSQQDVTVEVTLLAPGSGIKFSLKAIKDSDWTTIPATSQYVVNTMRNVTLGKGSTRLCIVEHFLAAASIWGLSDLICRVSGVEMPLGDGSANLWIALFQQAGIPRQKVACDIELPEPICISKNGRTVLAVPDESFSATYLMDWSHPLIGKRWTNWDPGMDVSEIADARTFGSLKEHQLLGLDKDVVSFTPDGFTHELRFEDEPVRHKLLDFIGDLTLCGINPLRLKARFLSIKAGHELDVVFAEKLRQTLANRTD